MKNIIVNTATRKSDIKMNEREIILNAMKIWADTLNSLAGRQGYWKEKIWASEERIEALKVLMLVAGKYIGHKKK